MSKKLSVLVVSILAMLVMGCAPASGQLTIRGSGRMVTQEFAFSGFDRVRASQAFQVDIRQGEAFEVVVRVDEKLVDHLAVRKVGDTLEIGLKPPNGTEIRDARMTAEVTMPELRGLDLSGASEARISDYESEKALDLELSGSSSLQANVEAGETRIDLSGASRATLSGSTRELQVRTSGASTGELRRFAAAEARIDASGASEIHVNARQLQAEASGASRVTYLGNPVVGRIEKSGSASVSSCPRSASHLGAGLGGARPSRLEESASTEGSPERRRFAVSALQVIGHVDDRTLIAKVAPAVEEGCLDQPGRLVM
jgi:hypothetical protein